jgi:hypothetical protein
MEKVSRGVEKELKILAVFVEVYCRARHRGYPTTEVDLSALQIRGPQLCAGCAELLQYANAKRLGCPLDPKPSCKRCHIHCYGKDFRKRIREIMYFSGRRLILRGRLDYIGHYLF